MSIGMAACGLLYQHALELLHLHIMQLSSFCAAAPGDDTPRISAKQCNHMS